MRQSWKSVIAQIIETRLKEPVHTGLINRKCLFTRKTKMMDLFLLSLLLVFHHLFQFVVGSCVLCLQFLALYSQITTKLLHLDEEQKRNSQKNSSMESNVETFW